jgi:hypothetical protein
MRNRQRGGAAFQVTVVILLIALLALEAWPLLSSRQVLVPPSSYCAVVLDTGQVYFGKLERSAGDYPVLRDVFYIQSSANPETKQVSNMLVRRGKEWHGPDYMILNARHIVLIEPVGPDSQVAKLIAEQLKQQ